MTCSSTTHVPRRAAGDIDAVRLAAESFEAPGPSGTRRTRGRRSRWPSVRCGAGTCGERRHAGPRGGARRNAAEIAEIAFSPRQAEGRRFGQPQPDDASPCTRQSHGRPAATVYPVDRRRPVWTDPLLRIRVDRQAATSTARASSGGRREPACFGPTVPCGRPGRAYDRARRRNAARGLHGSAHAGDPVDDPTASERRIDERAVCAQTCDDELRRRGERRQRRTRFRRGGAGRRACSHGSTVRGDGDDSCSRNVPGGRRHTVMPWPDRSGRAAARVADAATPQPDGPRPRRRRVDPPPELRRDRPVAAEPRAGARRSPSTSRCRCASATRCCSPPATRRATRRRALDDPAMRRVAAVARSGCSTPTTRTPAWSSTASGTSSSPTTRAGAAHRRASRPTCSARR